MKLTAETLNFIQRVVNTADLVKIDSIIIEPNAVRAIDDNHTVFIFHTDDVPDMEFGSIGLNRTSVFTSRFELGKNMTDFAVEATVEGSDPATMYARSLSMKAKGFKVEYRCANPNVIRAPKQLHDEIVYSVRLDPEVVSMLQKGQTAMTTDEVTIIGNEHGVFFEMSDINSDTMTYRFVNEATRTNIDDDEPVNFTHSYALKTILPLFKISPTGQFSVTTQGIMQVVVNGLNVYVMPRS